MITERKKEVMKNDEQGNNRKLIYKLYRTEQT